MKNPFFLLLALGAGLALSGCANTLNGAKQDAATDAQKTQQAAQQAGEAVAKVPQNAEANTVVRPAVKTAIIRDPVLAQSGNLINVNGSPLKITLTGHVMDASMKQRAEEDAQMVLKKHPGYTLENQLIVGEAQ